MIVEYIRYTIDNSRHNQFIEAYKNASEFLDQSEYCWGYELSHCEEDENNFILRIEWTSTEDHINGFRKSSSFAPFLEYVRPFYTDIEEMNHYRLTHVVKNKTKHS